MKELTIEQKAEAYDKALKAAIVAHKDEDRHLKATLEKIFPELKEGQESGEESNDIIKCLINGMRFYYEDNEEATWGTEKFSIKVKDILSWLEKQGEQNLIVAKSPQLGEQKYTKKDVDDAYLKGISDAKQELEKQGEQNLVLRDTFGYEDGRLIGMNEGIGLVLGNPEKYGLQKSVKWSKEDESVISLIFSICDDFLESFEISPASTKVVKEDIDKIKNWLKSLRYREKHDEQKPNPYIYPVHPQPTFAPKSALEAIKEEKVDNVNKVEPKDYNSIVPHFAQTVDNVKPKFHEGDWLCENEPNNYARFMQILEIVNVQGKDRYRISRDIHKDEDVVEFGFVEKYYHKFAIQDAKDGDVLFHSDSASNGIFIFKEILQCGTIQKVVCYCDYDSEDGFCLGEKHTCCWTNSKILHPATKEQREQLEKAMADAGWEFDFETKELKNTEQNPIDKSESVINILNKENQQVQQEDLIMKPSLSTKQNFVWNEEDEHEVAVLEAYIRIKDWSENHIDRALGIVDKLVNKCKSSKDKILPQPKQEWSKEDEERIKIILSVLDAQVCWDGATGKKGNPYQREINWLNSLKDRVGCEANCTTTKEWSEEDEMIRKLLTNILNVHHPNSQFRVDPISSTDMRVISTYKLVTWLESLKQIKV